jgi:hypothetical protein
MNLYDGQLVLMRGGASGWLDMILQHIFADKSISFMVAPIALVRG